MMMMMMIIQWFILFNLINYCLVNCDDYLCNYLLTKSNNKTVQCISNECNKIIDPYSIIVKPNNCKTNILYLKFSSFKIYKLFLNKISWKLGDLFQSKINNQIRILRIYILNIDLNDQPIEHDHLNNLGINIDLYQLYLLNITNDYYFYQLIHFNQNDPQWDIIQIQFICNPLMRFDKNPCSIQIIPPSFFSPRRSLITTETIPLLTTLTSLSPIIKSNKKSSHLLIIILIPLLIMVISLIILIYLILKRSSKKKFRSQSSSIPSLSNNEFYSEHRENAKPYQISRVPSPHTDSLYKETQEHF